MNWPLKDIWPVELTILRYYQSKTLLLRLTNGEVMTYDFWLKRATESIRSRRQIFKEGCSCFLLNHFVPYEVGVLVSSLTAFLKLKDGSGFRKSIFFVWITAIVAQILRKWPHDCACSVILIPNMNSVCDKMEFITIKLVLKNPKSLQQLSLKSAIVKPQSACNVTEMTLNCMTRNVDLAAFALDYSQKFCTRGSNSC